MQNVCLVNGEWKREVNKKKMKRETFESPKNEGKIGFLFQMNKRVKKVDGNSSFPLSFYSFLISTFTFIHCPNRVDG